MIKCLIIDDEAPARALIRSHLSGMTGFEIVASLENATTAIQFLRQQVVDLVFLDIMMPKMTGLELLYSLQSKPKVIFTTGYREFAAEAFDLDVVDYLVKPITKERFLKAIEKFNNQNQNIDEVNTLKKSAQSAYMYFKVGRDQVKIFLDEILFIEGLVDYIKVHTIDRTYIASETLGYVEEKLSLYSFVRIHKSFIVSMEKVSGYSATQVMIGETNLPMGRMYKKGFLGKIKL